LRIGHSYNTDDRLDGLVRKGAVSIGNSLTIALDAADYDAVFYKTMVHTT
jgi:hypothetical protein